jgi:DNA-binding transcriptional MerR regulator
MMQELGFAPARLAVLIRDGRTIVGCGGTVAPKVISAFSEEHTERLTGVSKAQLRYWDRTGFFVPSLADDRRRPNSRVYSFRDLVCLKVLNALRNEVRVSLPHLRDVKEKLAHLGDDIWARTTLYVLNRRVIIENTETTARVEVVSGQSVLQIPLKMVQGDMEKAVRDLWTRDKAAIGTI